MADELPRADGKIWCIGDGCQNFYDTARKNRNSKWVGGRCNSCYHRYLKAPTTPAAPAIAHRAPDGAAVVGRKRPRDEERRAAAPRKGEDVDMDMDESIDAKAARIVVAAYKELLEDLSQHDSDKARQAFVREAVKSAVGQSPLSEVGEKTQEKRVQLVWAAVEAVVDSIGSDASEEHLHPPHMGSP